MISDIRKAYFIYNDNGADCVDFYHLNHRKHECIGDNEYIYGDRNFKIYVKVINGFKYLHRSGGFPALILPNNHFGFFEYGFNKRIEDLSTTDDYVKVILKLKYNISDNDVRTISYTGNLEDDIR